MVKAHRGTVPHPLQLMVREPRRLGFSSRDGVWLRFVDVVAALRARTYAPEASIAIELDDPLFEANAGRWEVSSDADGVGTVRRARRGADVALDVGALTSIDLGAGRFAELATAGRATELRPGALRRADALFATNRAPFCDSGF